MKIDPDLPLELAALFGCAVLTGVGAVVNTAKLEPGQSVAVVGLGGVGLSVVLGARLAGARQIIAVDLSDEKLAFATKLGATQTVNARSNDAVGEIRRMSGNGVDVAFEMAGSVPALELAYAATARGGTTVTAGLPHPDKRMSLSPLALVAEERTLKGSYVGSSAPQRDVPRMIALFRAGRLPVDQLLTHRLKLEEINEGFDRLREGRGGAAGHRVRVGRRSPPNQPGSQSALMQSARGCARHEPDVSRGNFSTNTFRLAEVWLYYRFSRKEAMPPRTAKPQVRALSEEHKRAQRIFARLVGGESIRAIAASENLSVRRVQQIVVGSCDRRDLQSRRRLCAPADRPHSSGRSI